MRMLAPPASLGRPRGLRLRHFLRHLLRYVLSGAALVGVVGLGGCVTVREARLPPSSSASSEVLAAARPAPARSGMWIPDRALPSRVDFRVLDGRVRISGRDYVLDRVSRPEITPLGGDVYRLAMTFRRDARSSLRGDEVIETTFFYDGVELIFFRDSNRNHRLDRRESGVRHVIDHKQEIVTEGGRRFARARTLTVRLAREHVNSSQRVRDLVMTLHFQAQ